MTNYELIKIASSLEMNNIPEQYRQAFLAGIIDGINENKYAGKVGFFGKLLGRGEQVAAKAEQVITKTQPLLKATKPLVGVPSSGSGIAKATGAVKPPSTTKLPQGTSGMAPSRPRIPPKPTSDPGPGNAWLYTSGNNTWNIGVSKARRIR